MNESVFDLAKASDCLDEAKEHLERAERRNVAPAASVAAFARLALTQLDAKLHNACHEVLAGDDGDAVGDFPP